jgi:hypothetical protein
MDLAALVSGYGITNNGLGYSVALVRVYKPTKSCLGQLSVRIGYTLSCKSVDLLIGYVLNVLVVSFAGYYNIAFVLVIR